MLVHISDLRGKKIRSFKFSVVGAKTGGALDIFSAESVEEKIFPLYPEDDISDLKEKIFLAADIMPCEQLIWAGKKFIGHTITVDNAPYKITLGADEYLGDIPLDRHFYNSRASVKIFDCESTKISGITEITVYSLKSLQLKFSPEDTELVYWSLVKYFPHFDIESFKDYLRGNLHRFPLLFPDKSITLAKHTAEIGVLDAVYEFEKKNLKKFELLRGIIDPRSQIQFKINRVTVLVQKRGTPHLENIFVLLESSEETPFIIFHNRGSIYTKIYNGARGKYIPTTKKTALLVVARTGTIFEITRDGSVTITLETPVQTFEEVRKIVRREMKIINAKLSELELNLFSSREVIDRYEILSLESVLTFVLTFEISAYNQFMHGIRESLLARPTQRPDGLQFTWSKGAKNVYEESANQFSYKQIGEAEHTPKNVFEIVNRYSQIDIEIKNISESDFNNLYRFLIYFLSQIPPSKVPKNANNLKLLRTIDPLSYDAGEGMSTYSRFCQKPMQPRPVQEDDDLSKISKDRLLTFWNYTRNEPMTYFCPNPKFPYPGFAVGYHPEGFCSVCCRKKKIVPGDNKFAKAYETCMRTKKFVTEESASPVSYIIHYGKPIEAGRLGDLPDILNKFLIYNLEDINIISESHTLRIFRYRGKVYSLERLEKYTEATKVQQVPLELLIGFLETPVWRKKRKGEALISPADVLRETQKYRAHYRRITAATEEPILIHFEGRSGTFVVLDGNHRLANAYRMQRPSIAAKLITQKQLARCVVGKYGTDDISFVPVVPSIKKGGAFVEKDPFYYLLGVVSHIDGENVSYISSIAGALGVTIDELLKSTIKLAKAYDYIEDYAAADVISALSEKKYDVEMLAVVLPVLHKFVPIILDFDKKMRLEMQHKYQSLEHDERFILLLRVNGVYNPIVVAIPYSFGKTNRPEISVFDRENVVIQMLLEVANKKISSKEFSIDRVMEMTQIHRVLNFQGEAFGVEIFDGSVFVAIEPIKVPETDFTIQLGNYSAQKLLAFIREYSQRWEFPFAIDKIFTYGSQVVAVRINGFIFYTSGVVSDFGENISVQELAVHPETILNAKSTREDPILAKYLELESHRNDYLFYREKTLNGVACDDLEALGAKLARGNDSFGLALSREISSPLKKKLFCRGIYNFNRLYFHKHKNESIYVST